VTASPEKKRAAASLPAVYRPPLVVRVLLTFFGIVCAGAAAWQLQAFLLSGEWRRLAGALLVALPCLTAVAINRRCVIVQEEGVRSVNLLGSRFASWQSVRRLDQTRSSFVIETESGPISAGWLARAHRDRLLRQVLERAQLIARPGKLRWGLTASYIPRAQIIALRKTDRAEKPELPSDNRKG
jgi:hypothetical protein